MKLINFLINFSALALAACGVDGSPNKTCLCLPEEACWPGAAAWSQLNSTVGGTLVETTPIGSPCHDPNYDENKCQALIGQWKNPLTQ